MKILRDLFFSVLLIMAFVQGGCAHTAGKKPNATEGNLKERMIVLNQARTQKECSKIASRGLGFECDCVGFVRAAFWADEKELFVPSVAADPSLNDLAILFRSLAEKRVLHRQSPRLGDLVFFDPTPSGNDLFPQQVGLVDRVRDDGTLEVIGWFAKGFAKVLVNLRDPSSLSKEDGTPINTTLGGNSEAPAGQFFRTFANPFGD